MLIVEVKNNDSIDRALKVLKSKVIKTKQQHRLTDKKEYTKKSVRNRSKLLKAIYTERKRNS